MPSPDFQFHIDLLRIEDGMAFVSGWTWHPHQAMAGMQLQLALEDGQVQTVHVETGQARPDVARRFTAEAGHAGFLVLAGFGQQRLRAAWLDVQFEAANGAPAERIELLPSGAHAAKAAGAAWPWSKAIELLRRDGVRAVAQKTWTHLRSRPVDDQAQLDQAVERLQGLDVVWIVDHDMGGGANLFRQDYVAQCLRAEKAVALLSFHVASLGFFLEFHAPGRVTRHAIASLAEALAVGKRLQITQAIYNCAVSMRHPLEVVGLLQALQRATGCALRVLVHDYFCVCPSHVLLDAAGQFCGVPDESTCQRCLSRHQGGFVSAAHVRDIARWRGAWGDLLAAADEVQLFSDASWQLLRRAYPDLSTAHWRLQPHALLGRFEPVSLRAGRALHVGVVGTLGVHKGADIVVALGREMQIRHAGAKLTVVGTLQSHESVPSIEVTGAYAPGQLAGLLRDKGINIVFFSSIWPETFSYVMHELCAMGVPVACFDMGAQADLVRTYARGKIFARSEAGVLLDALEQFWHATYFPEGTTP